MTRSEHIAWCKKRAIQEMEYSKDPKQGIVSMMSDLRKHPDTDSDVMRSLCAHELASLPCNMQTARKFIDGFN